MNIDTEKLIAEIEKLKEEARKNALIAHDNDNMPVCALWTGKQHICTEFLSIISSLQQEQPEVDLDKEIDAFFYGKNFKRCNDGVRVPGALMRDWQNQKVSRSLSTDEIRRFARHFAEWGAIHLNTRKEEDK